MTIDAYDQHESSFEEWRESSKPVATSIRIQISDHALLRYLERACGMEIEAMREELAGILSQVVRPGRRSVVRDGLRFIFRGDTLATVYENRAQGAHVSRRKGRGRP